MKYIYKSNLDFLISRDRDLALKVESINIGSDIEVLFSREGLPSLKVNKITVHSTYYPDREGKRTVESYDIDNADSIIVFGLGLGYHIFPILQQKYPRQIIIIEHRPDILKVAMDTADLKPLMQRCRLLVGLSYDKIISDNDVISCTKASPLIIENRPSVSLYRDYYNQIKQFINLSASRQGFENKTDMKPSRDKIKRPLSGKLNNVPPSSSGKLNILMASLSSPISSPFYYEKALRRSHNVITFGPSRDRSFWADFAESLKSHHYYREGTAEHWTDICSRLTKPCDIVTPRGIIDIRGILQQLPSGFKPDLFIWIDQHGENLPDRLEHLDCPGAALFGDTHLGDINWRLQYARNYDYIFVMFNKQHIPLFREAGCQQVFWSPAACDPEIHCRITAKKIYPVSFVGSTHPDLHHDRVTLFNFLKSNNIDIYIDSKLLQEMSLVFSRSKLVLNKNIAEDLNQRVFEVLGTGSLLLTNRLNRETGLEDLFKDRQHLVIYDNETDLLELIRYYLENEDEREAIALSGYREALNKHTYDRRVKEIIRTVLDKSYSHSEIKAMS
jgi:hypothetical protein